MSYRPGENYGLCDYCGMQYYMSELKRDWQGFYACNKDFTLRNPQDFIRPVIEKIVPAVVRPDDGQGDISVITMINAVPSVITASLVDLRSNFQTNTSGIFALTLPSANDVAYNNFSILLTIELVDSLTSTLIAITSIAPATGTLVGSQVIRPGTIAAFRNYPASNKWIRER